MFFADFTSFHFLHNYLRNPFCYVSGNKRVTHPLKSYDTIDDDDSQRSPMYATGIGRCNHYSLLLAYGL